MTAASTLPLFDHDGLLPPGDYRLTLEQLRESILVRGVPAGSDTWDAAWRLKLVDNLEVLVRQLWQIGITDIFVDGSFVSEVARDP